MTTLLLKTKLYIPPLRPGLVARPLLIERLNAGLERKLALVSAPAGFGKTTLLSSWIHQGEIPAGWVSLDEGDNDPVRFLTYFIAALQTIEAGIGETPMAMIQSLQPPPIESILTALINEIADAPQGFVLVLDDYHLVEAQPIHDALAFLLAHLPPRLHLIIVSRSDPFLPLSRLRARGQMIDIRADDLRFSPQETTAFLNQEMGLGLSGDQVATLGTRTEGWIAGLQLAAHSMRGYKQGDGVAGFISAFAGDDRYIADYLVDEVLARQPQDTRDFMLQTSILDRLTGPLCDAVRCSSRAAASTGRESGQNVLKKMEQANLFIVPLDSQRRWYRYHHLFSDLLRQRLEESATSQEIISLHRRASQWYEENGFPIKAVEHGLAAEDYDDVVRLILQGAQNLLLSSQQAVLLGWWAQLPQELIASQPRLCMTFAWAWLATGQPEKAERCLQAVEQTLNTELGALYAGSDGAQTLSPKIQGALAEVAVVRAQLAIGRGDIPEALNLSRLALPYLEDDEGPYLLNTPVDSRLVVLFTMGLVQKRGGDLGAAGKALSAAAILGQERGNVHIVAVAYGHLANAQVIQGHLCQAVGTCQQGLQVVQEMAGQRSPVFGLLRVELGNLLYERNDLGAALHHLQEGISLAKPWRYRDALLPGYTGLARLRAAQGDWDGAHTALDELAAFGKDNPQAVMPAVEAFRAMLWATQGKVNAARRWAQTAGLDVDGETDSLRKGELVILARVLMVQESWDSAVRLIDRLVDAAETGERWGGVIELLVLRALALDAQGDQDEALEALARALTLAEPEGYVRTFIDQGEPMAALLSQILAAQRKGSRAASQGITATPRVARGYVAELLAAFGSDALPETPPSAATLVEPLSERELEVLLLLKTALSGPEIARELTIALPTLRFHTRNIYGKLGVHNRIQAVTRAQDLGLL